MSAVNVVFNADTGQFIANVDGASKSVARSAESVATAKNSILTSFKMQMQAAKEVGASAQQMEAIQTRAAQQMASVSEDNARRVISSLDRISDRQKAVAAELATLNNVAPVTGSHGDPITDRQRAAALIRGGGVRSAENFASQFDAFNKLSSIAFPILGATTFAAEVIRGVVALKEMYDTAEKLPTVLRDAFDGFNAPIMANVDGLRKANDELEISIARLEHKPENLLALAMDEARVNADKLAASAASAAVNVEKLLKENKVGFGSWLLTGQIDTGAVSDEVNKRMQELKDLQRANRDALRSGHDTPEAAQQREQRISGAEQSLGQWARDTKTGIQSFNQGGKLNANVNILEGVEDYSDNLQDQRSEQARNIADQKQQKSLEEAAKRQQQAQEAARKAQEAMRKAIEAQRQLWQAQDDQLREAGGDTAALEANAWQFRIDALKKGSAGYAQQLQYAQHQLANASVAMRKEDAEAAKRAAEQANRDQATQFDLQRDNFATTGRRTPQQVADLASFQMLEALPANVKAATDRWREAQAAADRYAEEAQKAASKAAEAAVQQKAAYDLASVAMQVQTGQISRLDAAQQVANIHAEQYRQTLLNLRNTLAEANAKDPNGAEAINAQAALDKAAADRRLQVMQDSANNAAATWQGALKNANAAWVQDSQDSAKQVVAFYQQTLDGLNSNLADLMTGDKSHFAEMFKGISKTLAQDSLKHLEGPLLGMFGKADGSESNPYFVKVAGGSGMSKSLSGIQDLFKGFKGGGDDSAADPMKGPSLSELAKSIGYSPTLPNVVGDAAGDALDTDTPGGDGGGGGVVGGQIGAVLGFVKGMFGGHRAVGGGVNAGMAYDVGEMGRETFVPSTPGTIIPHNLLGGGGPMYHIEVANGVTPEQVDMRVRAALQQVHPHITKASVDAVRDRQRRVPATHS